MSATNLARSQPGSFSRRLRETARCVPSSQGRLSTQRTRSGRVRGTDGRDQCGSSQTSMVGALGWGGAESGSCLCPRCPTVSCWTRRRTSLTAVLPSLTGLAPHLVPGEGQQFDVGVYVSLSQLPLQQVEVEPGSGVVGQHADVRRGQRLSRIVSCSSVQQGRELRPTGRLTPSDPGSHEVSTPWRVVPVVPIP